MTSSIFTALIGAPMDGLRGNGCELMPRALREAGLQTTLNARDLGDLSIQVADTIRDTDSGVLAYPDIIQGSQIIREAVRSLLDNNELPLVVGGCCSVLIGCMAGMQDHNSTSNGLAFLDGHVDFYDGKTSPSGEVADMDLAIVTGHGARGLANLTGHMPLVAPDHVVAIGSRDEQEWRDVGVYETGSLAPGLVVVTADEVFEQGAGAMGDLTANYFRDLNIPFWLHLDLDILDERVLPAVDYLLPGGLDWDDLTELVTPIAASPYLTGVSLSIYNPRLDPERVFAPQIVDFLEIAFKKPL